MANLVIAFPEKTAEQRKQIAKDFYQNFIDTFVETVKFLSLSDEQFSKRVTGNFDVLINLYPTGQSVQLHSGHFFNWEYMNWAIAKYSPYPLIGVYMPIKNKALDKIIFDMRARYNTILLSAHSFKNSFSKVANKAYVLGLGADQNPGNVSKSFWLHFFKKLTPFVSGPENNGRNNNTAIIFAHFYKLKRGYYHADLELITTTPKEYAPGEITKKYVAYLESCIRKKPDNYLWSHRRWKHEFKEEYRKMLIE